MQCKPKVARAVSLSVSPLPLWSPRCPEGPSPQAGVAPAGTAEPLAKEREGGGVTKTWRTLSTAYNLPHHPPPYPTLLSPIHAYPPPHIDRHSSSCMFVCTCHLSPYGDACVIEKEKRMCVLLCKSVCAIVY